MTSAPRMRRGLALQSYLLASHAIAPLARPVLRRRLRKGKEDPERWQEKLGLGLAPRPEGPLIWLHGVGLGEVLSLRGLIAPMAAANPALSFLVTSTTALSASVFADQLPARTLHQFLPLDAPPFRRRFLDHFRPNLCIWVEQDLWPGFVSDLDARGIPQAIVAARMMAKSHKKHRQAAGLFADIYSAMKLVTAQDNVTARYLADLGAKPTVTGSLKPAAPPLDHDPDAFAHLRSATAGRFVWAVSPAHEADAALAIAAHQKIRAQHPKALLIIAPRFPERWATSDLPRRSTGALPKSDGPTWLFDTMGEMGLIYRLTSAVLIGGTFDATEGHNPWEAAMLDNAIVYGPRTAHFAPDFARLSASGGALQVHDAESIASAVLNPKLPDQARAAAGAVVDARKQTEVLARDLLTLIEPKA